jgi:hypothetical protein
MDYSTVPNPYDFASPVSDLLLFAGRSKELEEIRYYLNLAKTADRPINIALLGDRASGKTSLLNMADAEARKRDLCSVRVDLDEDDAKTQLSFFHKLFDAILTACCDLGAYEGIAGKTYQTYLDVVYSLEVPEEKTFCPFLFPMQYARAMSKGNSELPISEPAFKRDLETLRKVLGKPILVLFDEGNVLSHARVQLQKLRNIFMNTPGFMLVMTGTPELFPAMDEVFSPIIRQFRKIEVAAFKSREETSACIRNPLEKIGVTDISTLLHQSTIREVHQLSGGRPYEIQLVCHSMFKRVQENKAQMMNLNFAVLEDVRNALETSQDITIRRIPLYVRTAKKTQLRALQRLTACDGKASFDQVWAMEYILHGRDIWTPERLRAEYEALIQAGVLSGENGKIIFAGDYFDRLYTKYLARESGIYSFVLSELTPTQFLDTQLSMRMDPDPDEDRISSLYVSGKELLDLRAMAAALESDDDKDVFVDLPGPVIETYMQMVNYQGQDGMPFLKVVIEVPSLSYYGIYRADNPADRSMIDTAALALQPLRERVEELGGAMQVMSESIPVVPWDRLAKKVLNTSNASLREHLAERHGVKELMMAYADWKNEEAAMLHAELCYQYDAYPSNEVANNVGYLSLKAGKFPRAKEMFRIAIQKATRPVQLCLARYNYGSFVQ